MLGSVLQPTHLMILLVVALLVLGPKKLPEAGRSLGQGIKEFKHSISGLHDDGEPTQSADTGGAVGALTTAIESPIAAQALEASTHQADARL
jgi:sec-independent protein translocase protein TatA